MLFSKRSKGHGRLGRGGWGECGGGGAGSRCPTSEEVAKTGTLKALVEVVLPGSKKKKGQ